MQFNIFDAMRRPTEDHSLCSMDVIGELVEKYNQFDSDNNNMTILVEISNMFESAGSVMGDADSTHINGMLNCPNSGNLQIKVETDSTNLMSTLDPPLPKHLKYTYLDQDQQFPIIVANNLDQEQEEKLLTSFGNTRSQSGENF
ncbi:hypothetical protein CR513_29670, partial [Mucuna pruriens]